MDEESFVHGVRVRLVARSAAEWRKGMVANAVAGS